MFEKFEIWFKATEAFKTITQGKDVKPFCKEAWVAATKECVDEVKATVEDKWKELSYAADKYHALEKKYQEALEVIEFYAETNNWIEERGRNNLYTVVKDDASDDFDEAIRIGGKKAREFLSKKNAP
jgi:hypothetical protein